MGQHFVSILAMLHIANKQKDPELISRSLYIVSAEAVRSVAKHTSGTQ